MARISDEEYAEMARESRSGAHFRAMRDKIGWTIRELASELGEDERTVKHWENPSSGWLVTTRAWEWMDKATRGFDNNVDRRVAQAHAHLDETGADGVTILYRRNGMRRGAHYPAGSANAVARAVGEWLASEGYDVRYEWPLDERDERFFEFEERRQAW